MRWNGKGWTTGASYDFLFTLTGACLRELERNTMDCSKQDELHECKACHRDNGEACVCSWVQHRDNHKKQGSRSEKFIAVNFNSAYGTLKCLVTVRKPRAPSRTGHHGDGSLVPANVSAGVAGSTVNAAGAISTRLLCPGAGSAGLLGPHSGAFKKYGVVNFRHSDRIRCWLVTKETRGDRSHKNSV